VALGAAAIYVSLLIRERRRIGWDVRLVSLVQVGQNAPGEIEVLYDGRPVSGVEVFTIDLANKGNAPIRRDDYEHPIQVSFGEARPAPDAEILRAGVTPIHGDGMDPKITWTGALAEIEPLLLNGGDRMQLEAVVANARGCVDLQVRAAGVRRLEKGLERGRDWISVLLVTVCSFSALVGIAREFIHPGESEPVIRFLIALSAAFVVFSGLVATWRPRRSS
jgi:hypothetical protein